MSDKTNQHKVSSVNEPEVEINEEMLAQLSELIQSPYKKIYQDGPMTIIEFENGQILPLSGGGSQIIHYTDPICSFCGRDRHEVGHIATLSDKNEPAICHECAIAFVELFAQNGVEINLNIPVAPEMANMLSGLRSQISPEDDEK